MTNIIDFPGKRDDKGLDTLKLMIKRLMTMAEEGRFNPLAGREIEDLVLIIPSKLDDKQKYTTVTLCPFGTRTSDVREREREIIRDCYNYIGGI